MVTLMIAIISNWKHQGPSCALTHIMVCSSFKTSTEDNMTRQFYRLPLNANQFPLSRVWNSHYLHTASLLTLCLALIS